MKSYNFTYEENSGAKCTYCIAAHDEQEAIWRLKENLDRMYGFDHYKNIQLKSVID